ncbi:hypothetical protein C8R44DRAFT_750907 [Mycena epipterygia]|nr:hypothetical protein C8R44DRAFT_750907 [Mycena epipterygia]
MSANGVCTARKRRRACGGAPESDPDRRQARSGPSFVDHTAASATFGARIQRVILEPRVSTAVAGGKRHTIRTWLMANYSTSTQRAYRSASGPVTGGRVVTTTSEGGVYIGRVKKGEQDSRRGINARLDGWLVHTICTIRGDDNGVWSRGPVQYALDIRDVFKEDIDACDVRWLVCVQERIRADTAIADSDAKLYVDWMQE